MEALTRLTLTRPWLVAALLAAITAVATGGALELRSDTGFRVYLGSAHPVVEEFDRFIDAFGGGLPVAAVWSCEETELCETVFDPPALLMAAEVTDALRVLPGVRSVHSPATSEVLRPAPDGFEVVRAFAEHTRGGDLEDFRRRAVADGLWIGKVISPDARTGAVILELGSSDSETSILVIRALRETLAPWEERGVRFHLVGQAVELLVTDEELAADSARLVPVIVLLIAIVIFALFRSWQAVLGSLLSMGLALLWVRGAMGWLGFAENAITQTIAPLIMVVGIADAIHLLSRYGAERVRNPGDERVQRQALLVRAAAAVGPACLMTTLTTTAGVLSFVTSGAEAFARFGVIASIGIVSALVACFTALPLVMWLLPADAPVALALARRWESLLETTVQTARQRRGLVLLGTLAMLVVSGVGLTRLRAEVDPYELYGPDARVVRWARYVESVLRPPDTLEIELTPPTGSLLLAPEALSVVRAVEQGVAEVPGLGRPTSIVQPLLRLNEMVRGSGQGDTLPSLEANAELLLLLTLQGGESLDAWLSLDRSRARISIEAEKMAQSRRQDVLRGVREVIANVAPEGWSARLTGPVAVYAQMVDEIYRTQLRSFGAAAAAIFLLMSLFLRSPGLALVGMIPTLFPVAATLGAMGYWGINLDMGTAMVAAVVLGIAVDDTLHLLGQYRVERATGAPRDEAILAAAQRIGRAVITTSFALSFGFFAMILSSWQSIASFGLLSGVAILTALMADLFILPALLTLGTRAKASGGR